MMAKTEKEMPKEQVINLFDKEYKESELSDEQKKMYQKMFVRYNDTQDKLRGNTKTWRELLPNLEKSIGLYHHN